MFRLNWQALSSLFLSLLLMLGTVGLVGCDRDRVESQSVTNIAPKVALVKTRQLSEASPPKVIQELNKVLEQYQPQVNILSPKPGETLPSTTVEVKLSLQDLPTFQDPEFKLGPHLHLIVDNNPYIAIFDASQPFALSDLSPGTHTLRVFASRPWHESFKNEGAYAQVTFNVITPTGDNNPDPNLPVLTFSRPKGEFGAEPIMLDYYLANAPLHWIAQENTEDDIADWRIRVTVNGESFVVDRWQPIYLKGFKEGDNWIQLEFLDENGDRVDNVFNNTVRLITYHAKGQDSLSKITRGELTVEQVRQIVDPTYKPPATLEEIAPPIDAEVVPEVIPETIPETIPEIIPQISPEATFPLATPQETERSTEGVSPKDEALEPTGKAEAGEQKKPESNLEAVPLEVEPVVIEPVEVKPVIEFQPEEPLEPVTETPTSLVPSTMESAIANPQSLVPPVPEAIASPSEAAEPETVTDEITAALDKLFEPEMEPNADVEPDFPDQLLVRPSPPEQPLSPGIRYFEE